MAYTQASIGLQSMHPRLLLVDDDEALSRSLGRVLSAAGYEVRPALAAQAAMNALSESSFDVVLSDVHMPAMDGLEVLRRIRRKNFDLPVVLMTGAASIKTAVEAVNAGALGYLYKPVEPGELKKTLDHAVQLGRLASAKREAFELLGRPMALAGDKAGLEAMFARSLDSLWMAYQPIISWSRRAIVGYEALLRSSDGALCGPEAVFDAAERLGRVVELNRSIRARVAETIEERKPEVDIFVNLHPQGLLDHTLYLPNLPLSRCARHVVFEVTERVSLDGVDHLRPRIAKLREMGYRVAIDDLGAGYAGLSTFAQLDPDVAKIDMSLVRGIDGSATKRKLIEAVAGACHDLGIEVLAEGVETVEERDALVNAGCDLLQGYLFARPGPAFPTVAL
jgi:EAL domain-containing protein (putative c-di-GMP-specific phosphodiesterase class I)